MLYEAPLNVGKLTPTYYRYMRLDWPDRVYAYTVSAPVRIRTTLVSGATIIEQFMFIDIARQW